MKINPIIKAIILVALLISPLNSAFAQAYINISESGNTLNISVSGSTYGQSVDLVYTLPGSTLQTVISNIGQTYSGSWSGNLNLNEYGIVQGSQVFARAGGQQSNTITIGGYLGGCTYNCGSPYGLSLSQTNVNLSVGQTQTITAYGSSNSLNIISNSNSNVASASVISGNQIRIYGLSSGSTTVQVCANIYGYTYNYNNNSCANIYITVSGSVLGTNTNLWFSPSNPNLYIGQSLAVSINSSVYGSSSYYSSNAYFISSNSNPNVVSANISGTVLNLYANQSGGSTINVCHSSLGFCSNLTVQVSGSGNNYGSVSFSQNNLTVYVGQSASVTAYVSGSSNLGNFYISSNSNSAVASAYVNGNTIYINGLGSGNATITVCNSFAIVCGYLYINVNSSSGINNNLWFSPSGPNLTVGQSMNVNIYSTGNYYGNYYISNNSNSNAVSASISGNALYLRGQNQGSSSITVCQSQTSVCATLYVTVSGMNYGNLWLSQSSVSLVVGQSTNVTINGNGSYYVSNNSNSNVAYASISGSSLLVTGSSQGNTNISVCQSGVGFQCSTLTVSVAGYLSGAPYSGGSNVLGSSLYKNGQLIKENNTIYIVYKNSKTGFANFSAFRDLGFKLSNVLNASYTGLADSGYVVSTAFAGHPWGSWIKSGQTVYFVHETGLIPVSDYSTFISNGGMDSWVVSANNYDFAMPVLSVMANNDLRLR